MPAKKTKVKSKTGSAKLKLISAKAKTIYKAGASGKKWTQCIKEASDLLKKEGKV